MIQPRLREIDRFFFITRARRLFTEVLVPDAITSGPAHVGLFKGGENAPDDFGAVFQGAIDMWQDLVTKKNGGIFGRSPHEVDERSCGVTLFADDVFEKSLVEKGTADGRGEFSAGDLRFATKRRETGDPAQSPEDGRKSKVLAKQAGVQIKASHRFLGIVYPLMLSMGAKIDQRTWATNRVWRELQGMWWNKQDGALQDQKDTLP